MKWLKIDKYNLPQGTVLSANFEKGTYGYSEKIIGWLYFNNGIVKCENEYELLDNCTHYIDINEFDII